ncbi:MAG TPA: outer membrane protein assembly factor BamE [Acetobacteraceae bacterium]|nr:outer membrane protein assembly factor BamE [Acetobacteraceae bacterium]
MRCVRALVVPVLLLGLAGCSLVEAQETVRGNRIDPDQLKQLTVGTSTRQDVETLLGSPTARATFDNNTWIYISEVTQPRIGRLPAVRDQHVTELTFNNDGVLETIKRLDKADGKSVAMASGATPSPGSEASFFQQLLGNVGRFTPGGGLSGGPSP